MMIPEGYVHAWMIYHEAAEKVDGHIKFPCTQEDYAFVSKAIMAGNRAMAVFMKDRGMVKPEEKDAVGWKQWNAAKHTALRRLRL